MSWSEEYASAWNQIREGLGDLGDDVDFARAFVGDARLLTLFERFDPVAVMIAVTIERTEAVIGHDECVRLAGRPLNKPDRLQRALRAAHAAEVREHGEDWRRLLPVDRRDEYIAELRRVIAENES